MTELLTIEQVAETLQVHPRTVRRAIDERGLRAFQVAGRGTWRVRPEDLDAWLEERANTTRPQRARRVIDVGQIVALGGHVQRAHTARRRASGMLTVTEGMGRTA